MNGSFLLAKVKGIKIQVHVTFVLILAWAAWEWGMTRGLGLTGALYGVIFTILLFLCVTLHELAHSLVARHYGMQVRDITLLPIGGLARLEGELTRPAQEFWMAIAGPAVNLVLAAVLGVIVAFFNDVSWSLRHVDGLGLEMLLINLVTANAGLAIFNLLPAFPMDGGRVLRALLTLRMDELAATRIAMRVGQGLAVILGLLGIFTARLDLLLVAMFIYTGARIEWRGKQLRMAMQQVPASAALMRGVVLSPYDPLGRAIDVTLRSGQADFAAFDQGYLVGVLTREDVAEGFQRYGANVPVQRVMRTGFPAAQIGETLFDLQHKMETSGSSVISLSEGSHFLGLATLESVRNALRLFLQWGPKNNVV
jgi:Zn-dependent protease